MLIENLALSIVYYTSPPTHKMLLSTPATNVCSLPATHLTLLKMLINLGESLLSAIFSFSYHFPFINYHASFVLHGLLFWPDVKCKLLFDNSTFQTFSMNYFCDSDIIEIYLLPVITLLKTNSGGTTTSQLRSEGKLMHVWW